ncbi:MAG: glycine/betaine/sarcosine/D-proline family reductase selenoprotein B [Chloroflexi bacterium]|nr:glycine/betaine/sarcosine/D-proline family reductase selenoprotein B [Chloroflexota bacterium]
MKQTRQAEAWADTITRQMYPGYSLVRNSRAAWTPLGFPLEECRVALVTTAAVHHIWDEPFDPLHGEWNEAFKKYGFAAPGDYRYHTIWTTAPSSEYTVTVADYDAGDARRDINCVFPVDRLRELDSKGVIGSLSPRAYSFYGLLPDMELLRKTSAQDVAASLREDRVSAAILTPGGPLSHQALAMIQRVIEGVGIPTISITLAPDITAMVKVPRAVSANSPMGNPIGEPFFVQQQNAVVESLLQNLYSISKPGTIVPLQLP